MADVKWSIKAREFVNCNCSYGCPCQFNGLPSYGKCEAVAAMQIDEGIHGDTRLDGLRFVGIFRWPGARSEERRVGKECRSRWWPDHEQKKKERMNRKSWAEGAL